MDSYPPTVPATPDYPLCLCLENILFPDDTQRLASTAFSAANEAIVVFDQGMNLVLANRTAMTLYGEESAATGNKCWRLFQKCTDICPKPEQQCWLKQVLTTGEPFRSIIDQVAASGEKILVSVSASPVFDDQQRIENVVVVLRNVTKELTCLRNAGFWRSSEVTSALLDSLGEGVVLIDPQFRIVDSNKKFLAMSGATADQVRGEHCYSVSHSSNVPCWQNHSDLHYCPTKIAFETGEAATAVHEHRDAAGGIHYVEVRALPLKDAGGEVFQVVETLHDITEQKKLEERLVQAQKMESIGNLAGGIAHDFNNILTPIMGNVELLLLKLAPGDALYNELRDIRTAAGRAAELVRHLLAFSRRQILQKQVIRLGDILREITPILQRLIPEDIALRTICNDDAARIAADPVHLEQIVMNLAVNARDAMPGGGTLVIETQKIEALDAVCHTCGEPMVGGYVRMMVSDTGVGMDAETLKRAFEPFFTTKEPGKGTGMGLATVLGIMHQHQGHVNVYSEPGLGTTFKIYFPTATEEQATGSAGVDPAAGQKLPHGTETVLVVDDDDAVRFMLEKMLQQYGYRTIAAANGAEGLAIFAKLGNAIDLVLTDVVMPEMAGKDMAKAMRDQRPALPILFMSGYSPNAIHDRGVLQVGVTYLQKPPTLKELLTKVRQVLDQRPGVMESA